MSFISKVILLLFVCLICTASSQYNELRQVINTYTLSQNERNADLAASLFAPYAIANAPYGTSTYNGRKDIQGFYSAFFNTTTWATETPNNDTFIYNGNIVSYTKIFACNWAPNGFLVINWFVFETSTDPPQIIEFSAIWNTSSNATAAF